MTFPLSLRLSLLALLPIIMVSCGSPAAHERFTVTEPFAVVNAKTQAMLQSMERPADLFEDGINTRRKDESPTHSNYALWYHASDTGNQWCTRYVDVSAAGSKTLVDVQTHEMNHNSKLMEKVAATFQNAKRETLPLKEGTSRDFWLLAYGRGLPPP